jgi:hypothetical protein
MLKVDNAIDFAFDVQFGGEGEGKVGGIVLRKQVLFRATVDTKTGGFTIIIPAIYDLLLRVPRTRIVFDNLCASLLALAKFTGMGGAGTTKNMKREGGREEEEEQKELLRMSFVQRARKDCYKCFAQAGRFAVIVGVGGRVLQRATGRKCEIGMTFLSSSSSSNANAVDQIVGVVRAGGGGGEAQRSFGLSIGGNFGVAHENENATATPLFMQLVLFKGGGSAKREKIEVMVLSTDTDDSASSEGGMSSSRKRGRDDEKEADQSSGVDVNEKNLESISTIIRNVWKERK